MSPLHIPESRFDVLSDVLDTLRFRGSFFFRSSLAAPWGLALEPIGSPRFHIVFSGQCHVGSEETDTVVVKPGEIIMDPVGGAHWIADEPGRTLTSSARAEESCELGTPLFQEGVITNRIMCGVAHFEKDSSHPILSSLPRFLHFKESVADAAIWKTVDTIEEEISRTKTHAGRIVDRLAEVLFLQLMNHYAINSTDPVGFLGVLNNKRIYHALSLIHQEPEYNWTIESLGSRVGMSRATLVRHFQDSLGMSPMSYLVSWRLTKAYSLIKYTTKPMNNIAESVGYASGSTLIKAFVRRFGYTPMELRSGLVETGN